DIANAANDTSVAADQGQNGGSGGGHTLTWVAFGVAGVAAVVGGVTGILAISHTNAAKDACNADNHCPPRAYDDIDAGQTFSTVSTVSFIVAGVAGATGLATLLFGGSSQSSTTASGAKVHAWIGPRSAGVAGA